MTLSVFIRGSIGHPQLPALLETICAQDWPDAEVIILSGEVEKSGLAQPLEALASRGYRWLFAKPDAANQVDVLAHCSPSTRYACFQDPQSWLAPSYAKALAGFLDANPQSVAVRCRPAIASAHTPSISLGHGAESGASVCAILARRTPVHLGAWMVRREALIKAEVHSLPSAGGGDWPVALRLAHHGSVGSVAGDLYRLVLSGDQKVQVEQTDRVNRLREDEGVLAECLEAIEALTVSDAERSRLQSIAKLASLRSRVDLDLTFRLNSHFEALCGELVRIASGLGVDVSHLDPGEAFSPECMPIRREEVLAHLTFQYADLLSRVLERGEPTGADLAELSKGFAALWPSASPRPLFIYGAGAAARDIVPHLLAMRRRPLAIWDRSARPGQELFGIPVVAPRLGELGDGLKRAATAIVALGASSAAWEVRTTMIAAGVGRVYHACERHGLRTIIVQLLDDERHARDCASAESDGGAP